MTVERRVVVVGAGMGGLAASIALSARGFQVTTLDAADGPGGKMREVEAGGRLIDAGPTVLTMPWVFEQIFEDAGARLVRNGRLEPNNAARAPCLGRWLAPRPLFRCRSKRRGDRRFRRGARGGRLPSFLQTRRVDLSDAARHVSSADRDPAPSNWRRGSDSRAFPISCGYRRSRRSSRALEDHFADPRLRQLFGRYATYCGSSPFLAPATLMLVAHVEREGVWIVEGGMARLAEALGELARARGAELRFRRRVARIVVENGRAAGVETDEGERIAADAVIWNGDVAALADGSAGPEAARAVAATPAGERSLSALTWAMTARTEGFPLVRHNVFFSRDYPVRIRRHLRAFSPAERPDSLRLRAGSR